MNQYTVSPISNGVNAPCVTIQRLFLNIRKTSLPNYQVSFDKELRSDGSRRLTNGSIVNYEVSRKSIPIRRCSIRVTR